MSRRKAGNEMTFNPFTGVGSDQHLQMGGGFLGPAPS